MGNSRIPKPLWHASLEERDTLEGRKEGMKQNHSRAQGLMSDRIMMMRMMIGL
jgi:hypothetical protein